MLICLAIITCNLVPLLELLSRILLSKMSLVKEVRSLNPTFSASDIRSISLLPI